MSCVDNPCFVLKSCVQDGVSAVRSGTVFCVVHLADRVQSQAYDFLLTQRNATAEKWWQSMELAGSVAISLSMTQVSELT